MTTAHRPTFDPAKGKDAQRGPAYHQRLLPAHTQLKTRQPGQGGAADGVAPVRDLRAQLLEAEAAHFKKSNPEAAAAKEEAEKTLSSKRQLEEGSAQDGEEDLEAKRRRILEETRDVDAASDSGEGEESSEEESDDEDEEAELLRELEKIKRERAEKKEAEEREKAAEEQDQREKDIALGNPLLMPERDGEAGKRRWDDDVVFRNQARGTEKKGKAEFVNDLLRSDFHKRFMSKYVR